QRYPELVEALNESRDFVDSLVEDALLKRALGYEYEEVKMIASQDGKTRRVEKIRKHVVPDVTAQIFWLKNRKPHTWRDRPTADGADAAIDQLVTMLARSRQEAGTAGDEAATADGEDANAGV